MTKFMTSILVILLAVNTIIMADAEEQSMPSSSSSTAISGINSAVSENNVVKIIGLDSSAFPKIKVNLFIDKFCAMSGNLKKEDFKVKEGGHNAAIDNFYFSGNASRQKLDLAIVFDETTSMDAEIDALKSKVKDLTQKVNSSKLDARYSLVTFNGADVSTKINWTRDADSFRNIVGKLSTSGGNSELPENSLDGIERALSFGFRPDAQKALIVVTDEPSQQKGDGKSNSAYTMDDVKKDILNSGAMLIAVSPDFRNRNDNPGFPLSNLPKYADMRVLANEASSLWIDMNSADFSTILKQIQGILTGTYVIEYTSTDQTPSENRTVSVSVNAPGCVEGSDSSSYISPGSATSSNNPPIIDDLTSVLTSPQDAGTIITWTVNASDPDGDPVLYRFYLDDEPVTDWMTEKTWIWTTNDAGSYRVEVRVRDAKHADPNGLDDRKAESFTITEAKPAAPENQPPIINDLAATQDKGTDITWTTSATDPDPDQVLARYFLNNKAMTDWTTNNKWTLKATDANVGDNKVEVQIRDDKHAGPEGYDDAKSVQFKLSSMKLMVNTWERTFGNGKSECVQQTKDSGYIIAGMRGQDICLIKIDSSGDTLWDKTFGGSKHDEAHSIQQTSDGGYIITGETESYGSGSTDVWLIKTDSLGNKIWDRTFGGSDDDEGRSVLQTNDGGYIIAGSTDYSYKKNQAAYIWLIKTDSEGNKVWDRTFGESASAWAESAHQTSDGGYIVTGAVQSHNKLNVWIIKTDSQGRKEWDRTIGSELDNDSEGKSVQQTNEGGYIVLAYKFSSPDGSLWLIKTDSLGNKLWDKTLIGGTISAGDRIVQQTNDEGYIVTGILDGLHALLIKTDSEGNEEWHRTLGGQYGNSVQQTIDGGFIVAGGTGDDVWLIKTDANGNM